MSVTYELIDRVPTPDEHRRLAISVGWEDAFRWNAIPVSLVASRCGVIAIGSSGEIVGMGRAVGDGSCYFYLQDTAVHPDHHGHGLGQRITQRLLEQVRTLAGGDAFVGLFSTDQGRTLYRRAGFSDQTSMYGMWRMVRTHGPTQSA